MNRHTRAVVAGRRRQRATRPVIRTGSAVTLMRGSPEGVVTDYDGANVTVRWPSGVTGTYHKTAIRYQHGRYVR